MTAIAVAGKRYLVRDDHGAISYIGIDTLLNKLDRVMQRMTCRLLSPYLKPTIVQLSSLEEYASIILFIPLPRIEPGPNKPLKGSYSLRYFSIGINSINKLMDSL
jgi:hypothetical protein